VRPITHQTETYEGAAVGSFMAVHIEFKSKIPGAGQPDCDLNHGLAGWLKDKLQDAGIYVGTLNRYDWGFEIPIHARGGEYYAGLPTRGEGIASWHVFVDRRLSIRDRVLGRSMPADEPMVALIKEIIARDPQFKVVSVQEQH